MVYRILLFGPKHKARLITYVDVQKRKLITLLTHDMEFDPNEVIAIYRKRWEIQADEAKLPTQILLWRKCKRN